MTQYERKSVWVSKIDVDKATKLMQEKYPYPEIKAQNMAVVVGKDGVATICDEGVGWFANNDGNYLLVGDYGYAEPSFRVTPEELISVMSDEFMYLDEFIRSFGARLEANYSIWYEQVQGYSQQPHNVIAEIEKCRTPVVA